MSNREMQTLEQACIWRDGGTYLPTLADAVHIWRVRLQRNSPSVQRLAKCLSSDERNRACSYRFLVDRHRFVVRRALLRIILGRYLDQDPHQIKINSGQYGKPRIACQRSPSLQFSVTHSCDESLIALTKSDPVGIDIELVRPLPDLELMIDTCLSQSEKRRIDQAPPTRRLELFYRHWTCKEAYLKARGVGLNRHLSSLGLQLNMIDSCGSAVPDDEALRVLPLSIHSFVPIAGYVAAIATFDTCIPLELFAI